MSFFSKTITVAKNTSAEHYTSDTIEIQFGIIHRVHISVPSGHAGLTGIRILQGLHQIAPTSGSEWFQGDDMELDYNDFIEIDQTPFELTVEAYNTDDTYAHTFRVGIGVMPRYVLLPQEMLKEILQGVSSLLGAMGKWFGMKSGG